MAIVPGRDRLWRGHGEQLGDGGFFPVFIAAIVWIRGFSCFNLRFLRRMALCGLRELFCLLLPLLAVISGKLPVTFWETMKVSLAPLECSNFISPAA